MRSLLLTAACVVPLCSLPAQEPSSRPAATLPPPAAEATAPRPDDAALAGREAAARRLVQPGQPLQRVVFDQPRADGPLWAIGTAWKASFDATGFTAIPYFGTAAPRNFPLRFELAGATVGGEAVTLVDGTPAVNGARISTPRGGLTEVVDARLDSLEQSFVFDVLPNRGTVAVDVRIASELAASPIEGGLRFANEFGHVDYTKAVAVDAAGRRLPLAIEWNGSSAHIEIPAAFVEQAQLPLVLDPVLNYWFGLASGQAQLQHDSDVASFQSLGGRTLIVYQRQWSLTDQDCWGVLFDGNLGLVQTDFPIDFTSEDWLKVAVAANNYAQNFLVVSEIRIGVVWFIGGRTIASNATVGTQFDIERDGVVGLPGNNFHPDVGSDPYSGPGRYCVVFNKRTLTTADIYMRQVSPNGSLVTTNPIAISTASDEESKPAISKSCGQSNGQPANWLLVWQKTWVGTPYDQEVWGRFVSWNGALIGTNNFAIAFTPAEETAPSPGSPIDANGTRFWPMVHETATTLGQPRDVVCKLLTGTGNLQASFTVNTPVPGEDDKEPEIDADGTRFVVTRTKSTTGFPAGVEAVTAAWLPATNTFRVDERTSLVTSSLDNYAQTNICADYSGGTGASARYFLSFTEQATNTFRLENFGGWLPGQFFTTVATQCGTTTISVTGDPVIGQTITFNVNPGPLAAVHIGTPSWIPLNAIGCNCVQAVDPIVTYVAPWSWTIPNLPAAVGLALSAQGFHITGSQCLGFIDLSNTIDFTIR